jgi:GxxExxY protein
MPEPSPEHDRAAREIVDSALAVHSTLGPGLLESVYEECLAYELRSRGLEIAAQVALPVVYREVTVDAGFRMDMVVSNLMVVEIKAVEKLMPIHEAQLLTYLKLSRKRLGFLINFNSGRVKDGIRRLIL